MHPATPARETTPPRAFEFVGAPGIISCLNQWDAYSAAMAFIRGDIQVAGDFIEAVRYQLARQGSGFKAGLIRSLSKAAPWHLIQLLRSRKGTAHDIRFHYDRSNDFYKEFLDRRMVYSCAYFKNPYDTLDQAQEAKLDHISRKLLLAPQDRFLDIGCGWGALVMHAAGRYGIHAEGCTLSVNQVAYARDEICTTDLGDRAVVHDADYRDLSGTYDKIASVGMFEHVGLARLRQYFRKVHSLLHPGGLFLNHGITRPAGIQAGTDGLFIARHVFPGGEIVGLADVIRAAEQTGFEVLDVESLRRHYALTCRAWVERLRRRRDACLRYVDEQTWRIWQLYLAGSAVAFEEGDLGLHQVLMRKRAARDGDPRPDTAKSAFPLTREYIYN